MKNRPMSHPLYALMLEKGYPAEFSAIVACELHTDFTAGRMMGYLSRYVNLPMEEVADEMLAILSERDAIVRKKQMESSQAVINDVYNFGLYPNDGEEKET